MQLFALQFLLSFYFVPNIKIFLLKVDRATCLLGDFFTWVADALAFRSGEACLGAKDDRRAAEATEAREETSQRGWILLGGTPGSIDKFASGQKACLACIPRSVHRPCKTEPRFACAWRVSCVSFSSPRRSREIFRAPPIHRRDTSSSFFSFFFFFQRVCSLFPSEIVRSFLSFLKSFFNPAMIFEFLYNLVLILVNKDEILREMQMRNHALQWTSFYIYRVEKKVCPWLS